MSYGCLTDIVNIRHFCNIFSTLNLHFATLIHNIAILRFYEFYVSTNSTRYLFNLHAVFSKYHKLFLFIYFLKNCKIFYTRKRIDVLTLANTAV